MLLGWLAKAGNFDAAFRLAKGLLPVLIAQRFGFRHHRRRAKWDCSLLGHLYPLYLRFKGGKVLATAMGVCWL